MNEITPTTPIRHRHADGTEHSHAGHGGSRSAGKSSRTAYGDERAHKHLLMSSGGQMARDSGSVIWSERDAEAS